ncbi:MAG: hypothetical protein NTW19_21565 [Planctomycetota bacterium]|nr:hypothetical protein [Planctomycetota bacterium]
MSLTKRFSGGLFVAGLLVLMTGCAKSTYISTPELPTTLLVSETSTDKVLWSMDIPVQHKVKIRFSHPNQVDMFHTGANPATEMSWDLYTLNGDEITDGKVSLPGTNVLLNVQYRPAPEQPGVVPVPAKKVASTSKAAKAKPAAAATTAPAGK